MAYKKSLYPYDSICFANLFISRYCVTPPEHKTRRVGSDIVHAKL